MALRWRSTRSRTSTTSRYGPFVAAIGILLDAGTADGTLKPGIDPEDVLLQPGALWRIDPARGDADARAARILTPIEDGLRA
ncbi:hypothetical protein [Streptomyces sp. NPDC058457]|uniref:hypothetical protein n=1 Tax=Streptomyces sp. NPDC058457 TaxID=3346507 RepID=UPI00366768A3